MFAIALAATLTAVAPNAADTPADGQIIADTANPADAIAAASAAIEAGRLEEARAILADVVTAQERWRVETVDGEWVDSRHLAHRMLATLDDARLDDRRMASR